MKGDVFDKERKSPQQRVPVASAVLRQEGVEGIPLMTVVEIERLECEVTEAS